MAECVQTEGPPNMAAPAGNNIKDAQQVNRETVKETMTSTMEAMQHSFDLKYQVQQHPWMMIGGAAASGFLIGRLLSGESHVSANLASRGTPRTGPPDGSLPTEASAAQTGGNSRVEEIGLLGRLTHQLHDELAQVKGLAIGAVFALLRDWAVRQFSGNLAPQIHELLDNMTTKLGGTRFKGPVVENLSAIFGARSSGQE
jgi:hypothetical protein